MVQLGIVALESSHVDQYCRIFNLPDDDWHLEGARVVALCSQNNPSERIEELCGKFGIEIVVEKPEALVPLVDAALMLGRDGSCHCAQALPFLQAGKPCFVDKPFAHSLEDAAQMIETARANSAAITSSSALRYALEIEDAAHDIAALGELRHLSLIGPGELFFYGIHLTDLLMRLMGPGVEVVSDLREETMDLLSVTYGDGRSASIQILRGAAYCFALHLIGTQGTLSIYPKDSRYYVRQMEAFLRMIQTGEEPVPQAEMLEAVRILVAADRSAHQGGRPVRLAEVYPWKRPF
ncbi:MAG: Gfo/Idh/MocA family protein [Candidatus Zipacnadales bacterium]